MKKHILKAKLLIFILILILNTTMDNVHSLSSNKETIFQNDSRVIISNFGNVSNPSLIVSDTGYMVAFCSDYNGNKDIWVISSEDGITWTAPIQVTTNEYDDFHPSLIKTTDGKYYISYNRVIRGYAFTGDKQPVETDYYCIFVTSSLNGINWSSHVWVSDIEQCPWYGGTAVNQEAFYFPSLIEKEYGNLLIAGVFYFRDCMGTGVYSILLCNSTDGINWTNQYYEIHSTYSPVSLIPLQNETLLIAHEIEIDHTERGELIIINTGYNIESKSVYSNNFTTSNPSIIQNINESIFIFTDECLWINEGNNWNFTTIRNYFDPSVISYNNSFGIAYVSNNSIITNLPVLELIKKPDIGKFDEQEDDKVEDDGNVPNPIFHKIYSMFFILLIVILFLVILFFVKRKLDFYRK
jgi:hypothetical protein